MKNTIMPLNDRINQDLTELFDGKPISGAQSLSRLIEVSTKGLPQHFVGNRDAKTVLVMLNPGEDWAAADKHFCCSACGYDSSSRKKFIECYIDEKTNFGETDKDREDSFDLKQAAFLKAWKESGVSLPRGFPEKPSGKRAMGKAEQKGKAVRLEAKRAVLMEKLQLELVPYCSRTFGFSGGPLNPLFPFVDTLLAEIFRVKRKYVVFCAGIFEKVFKAYNKHAKEIVFDMADVKPSPTPLKPHGKLHGKCRFVLLRYRGQEQKALIAHTFASQGLSRAYALMQTYGEFCFDHFRKMSFK